MSLVLHGSNGVTYPDGNTQAGATAVAQIVTDSEDAHSSHTTVIPVDDTIPQITEGEELLTVTITPTNASSVLVIDFFCGVADDGQATWTIALFVDTTADAIQAWSYWDTSASHPRFGVLRHFLSAGSTAARTYKIRIGPAGGTLYINGIQAGRLFGGIAITNLTVTEYLP